MSEIVSGLTGQLTGVSQFAEHLGKYAPPTLHKYLYNNKHRYKHWIRAQIKRNNWGQPICGALRQICLTCSAIMHSGWLHWDAPDCRRLEVCSKIWKTLRRTWWGARCTWWSLRCTCWSLRCTCWRARCSAWVQPMGLACEVQGRAGQRGEEEKEQQLLSWENYHLTSYRYSYSLAQKKATVWHKSRQSSSICSPKAKPFFLSLF